MPLPRTAIRVTRTILTCGLKRVPRMHGVLSRRWGISGFGDLGLREQDFMEPGSVVQLGHPPQRISLLTTAIGVTFEECYKARMEIELDGVRVNFIALENLLRNKEATGRAQDLADIEALGKKPH